MSKYSTSLLEIEADVQRNLLAAELRELRQRAKPSHVARDIQQSAKAATNALVAKVGDAAKTHPIGLAVIGATLGATAAPRLHSGTPEPYRKGRQTPEILSRTSATKTASSVVATSTLIGVGAIMGLSLAGRIQISEQGRRLVDALVDDVEGIVVKTSLQQVNDFLANDSNFAAALKLAFAGVALLTQPR